MGVIREYLWARQALCFLTVLTSSSFVAEAKLVLARPALDGVVQKSPKRAQKAQKAPAVDLGGAERASGGAWKARLGWWTGSETGFVRCRNVRKKRTKSAGRLAMPWMTRRRERRVT